MTVLVVVPVLQRPHRVEPLLKSLEAATTEDHLVLFMATAGDYLEIEALDQAGANYLVLPPNRIGDYARKINHAYRVTSDEYLYLAADDLRFHEGWLGAALEVAGLHPEAGVIGTQDLAPTERSRLGHHSTHSLVRRSYIERYGTADEPGKILHEGYVHNFCDDELIGTAKRRGSWVFAGDSIVEHLHPSWGKAERDPVYDFAQRRFERDRGTFNRRRRLWR